MTLLEDVKAAVWEFGNAHWSEYADEVDAEVVNTEVIDNARWCDWTEAVLQRGDEYVAVTVAVPSTEMQDWSDWGGSDVTVKVVKPKVVSTTIFVDAS